MMLTDALEMKPANVKIVTTSNGGHSPEYYAGRITEKLIFVADSAPPEIREQARAYRGSIQTLVFNGIKAAILSDHTTIIARLREAGFEDAANLVFALDRR